MKVLYAVDGFEPAVHAGQLLAKIGDKARIDVTVMSVTHAGMPAPEHLPLVLDPVVSRRKDTLEIVAGDRRCSRSYREPPIRTRFVRESPRESLLSREDELVESHQPPTKEASLR